MEDSFEAARWLRAVRRARRLSQRELANSAGVPPSTVAQIEAGRRTPGLALFVRLVAAGGFGLELVDRATESAGAALTRDDEHDAVRDRGGRRFPAHLAWGGKPDYSSPGRQWWGWHNIAWYTSDDPAVPEHVYWHRPRVRPNRLGRYPRRHPFWG